MGWSCRRPGCHREAAVTIGYDPITCQVWLDPLGSGPPPAQMLCLDHAERLQPPRGWVVVDRRSAQTVIVAPTQTMPRPTTGRAPRRVPRRWGQLEEPRLEFTVDPTAEPVVVAEATVVAEPVATAEAPISEESDVVVVDPVRVPESEVEESEPEPEPEPVAEVEPEPEPVVERTDDLESLFQPRGRLLSRAFEAGAPYRNVLLEPED